MRNSSKHLMNTKISRGKMDKGIYTPKNIAQLRLLARNNKITFPGLDHSFTINPSKNKLGLALIQTDKIREFNTILKTAHTCVIGLGTTIEQFMKLTETEIPYPLLEACFAYAYSSDAWRINLMQAIFSHRCPPYIRLFLSMIDAQVQCMKDTVLWLSFRDLVNNQHRIDVDDMIPINIRFDLFSNTRYYLNTFSHAEYSYKYPLFYNPIIMGQIDLNENSEINDIYMLYADKQGIIQCSHHLKKAKEFIFPLRQSDIIEVWEGYNFEDIPDKYINHIKQALTVLLSTGLI